jgi:hypothetical protein
MRRVMMSSVFTDSALLASTLGGLIASFGVLGNVFGLDLNDTHGLYTYWRLY